MAIEGQQSLLRGGYHQLRFLAVGQQGRSKGYERRRWQFPAGSKLPGGGATKIVFQKAARPGYIKVLLKARSLEKNGGRANHRKARSIGRDERVSFNSNLPFRLDLFCGKSQRPLSAPSCKTNQQGNQCRAACQNHANQQFPGLAHWFPQNTSLA